MKIKCNHCGNECDKPTGHVNRSLKNGNKLYCSRECSSIARRSGKTDEQKRKEKAEYDKKYKKKNSKRIQKNRSVYYEKNKEKILQASRDYRNNDEYRKKHAEYCRRPEQRAKEKINRRKRVYGIDYDGKTKKCINCEQEKSFLDFQYASIFPDNRYHICRECEAEQQYKYGYSTKNAITAIVMRRYTNLTREDVAKHPYLIEANKYLILLKQLVQ